VEGPSGQPLMRTARDAGLVMDACFSHKTTRALLYASNMPEKFFDLSSGDAGEILQKLRNYRIRIAVVCPPGSVKFSRMFPEMAEEEARVGYFEFSKRSKRPARGSYRDRRLQPALGGDFSA